VLECGYCLEWIGTTVNRTQHNPHFEAHQRTNRNCLNARDLDRRRRERFPHLYSAALAPPLPAAAPTSAPAAPSSVQRCPGVPIEWGDEEVLMDYPIQRHVQDSFGKFPWKLCGYDEDTQRFLVRAPNCIGDFALGGPCPRCCGLTPKLREEYEKAARVNVISNRSYRLRSWLQLHELAQHQRGKLKLALFRVSQSSYPPCYCELTLG
jgi:hypothetical protein